jgi:hypothetical protein
MFRKNVSSPSLEQKIKAGKRPAISSKKSHLLNVGFSHDLLFDPEDGNCIFLRNNVGHLLNYMALQSRRSYTSWTPL